MSDRIEALFTRIVDAVLKDYKSLLFNISDLLSSLICSFLFRSLLFQTRLIWHGFDRVIKTLLLEAGVHFVRVVTSFFINSEEIYSCTKRRKLFLNNKTGTMAG